MCLILLSLEVHPDVPLILAANRDEFYARPSAPMHFWDQPSGLLAGQDLEAGGTWLGLRPGPELRWACVTNFREPDPGAGPRSRGELVPRFLFGQETPEEFRGWLESQDQKYAGYNLLYGVGSQAFVSSNRGPTRRIQPGIHGLSNHQLDTPWPKVVRGTRELARRSAPAELLELLGDESTALDPELPDTGVGLELERRLSPIFIRSERYGTRCSTVVRLHRDGRWDAVERSYGPAAGDREFCG